jgi:hypothetical protein
MFKWVWLQHQTQKLWAPRALGVATTPDPLDLGQDAEPICLGSGHLT